MAGCLRLTLASRDAHVPHDVQRLEIRHRVRRDVGEGACDERARRRFVRCGRAGEDLRRADLADVLSRQPVAQHHRVQLARCAPADEQSVVAVVRRRRNVSVVKSHSLV